MAQLPTVASTANRRVLPTATLQIEGGTPAAFGGAIGAGLQQIGQAGQQVAGAVADFSLAKERETLRLAEFDRQAQMIEFGSAEATRLEEESRDLDGPAQDFTRNFMGSFDQRATEFLERIPEHDRPAWGAKMAALRSSVSGDALRTEFGQRDAWSKTTLTTGLGHLLNGAAQTPERMGEWQTQGRALIESSLLSAQDKADALAKWDADVSIAAATGDVQRDPVGAIARLGGIDHTTALEAAGKIGGGANAPTPTGGSAAFVDPLRGHGGSPIPGGRYGAARDYGAHQGADFTGRRGSPVLSGAGGGVAHVSHSENGGNIVSIDHGGGVVTKYMHLDSVAVRDGQQVTGDTVLGALGATGRASGPHLHYEVLVNGRHVDPTSLAGKPTPIRQAEAAPAAAPAARGGSAEFNTAFADLGGNGAPVGGPEAEAPPIDPRYENLPLSARMQLIGAAQGEIDRRQQVQYAAQEAQHDEWLNGFMTELLDGKAGRADIEAARSSGRLTDYNEIAAATNIVEQREQKSQALDLYNAMIAGGGQFNPFDNNTQRAVDAAAAAQGAARGANGQPIGVAQAAFNIWQKTGVLAKPGAVALRGGLVSTDAQQVAAAASIASNMIQRNPNAFAGVEGGNEIEQAAALYSHYVNDLGLSGADAAKRVAARNTPEARRQVDMQQPAINDFRANLRKKDVGNMLSNAFGGWFSIDPEFTAPEQINAAAQDYADFAADHFSTHGDAGAAESYAMTQMRRLYGVVNGRLMKFPPTRSYPAVRGSYDYIFEQAAGDIKRVTGRTIDPDNVYLMPIPGATAEAFRAGRPAPYSIHYIDETGGQRVYRVIAGQAFRADVSGAQSAAGADFNQARTRAAERTRREIERSRTVSGPKM